MWHVLLIDNQYKEIILNLDTHLQITQHIQRY